MGGEEGEEERGQRGEVPAFVPPIVSNCYFLRLQVVGTTFKRSSLEVPPCHCCHGRYVTMS